MSQTMNKRVLGLRNIVTTAPTPFRESKWYHLLFYDIDTVALKKEDIAYIKHVAKNAETSFILFWTKHGAHFVGLTPLEPIVWACAFQALDERFHSYYSGQVLRLTPKAGEKRQLITYGNDGIVIPNLIKVYSTFLKGIYEILWDYSSQSFKLVFEAYKTGNL